MKVIQKTIRKSVQSLFLVIICFIGVRFYFFVTALEKGLLPVVERPPGVEAFLPISALVSLKYFIFTGIINNVHPSGLVLFLIICATALIAKKAFCAWICPIGLLSEYLTRFHCLIFKKGYILPPLLDRSLRSLKYLLAGFFIWSVFLNMPVSAVKDFIQSPYNILADINMFMFFNHMSRTAFAVISGLIIFSFIIPYFWCRYICPYGAVLGVLSFFSPGRINYTRPCCSNCGKCEKICPGRIKIRQGRASFSLECSACLECVNACPETGALKFSLPWKWAKIKMGGLGIAMLLILLFTGGITLAKISGHWQNKIPPKAYFYYMMISGKVHPG